MTELDDLFEQIFHSERKYIARADQLKALNNKIQDVQLELERGREELSTKQGELAVKNSKLADVEMEVKLLQLRKAALQDQKTSIADEKSRLFEEYQENLSALATERELFEERLKQFSHSYDLHGSGLKHREEEDKKTIATLQDELLLLETELVEIESYSEDVKKLEAELASAELDFEREKETERDLKSKLAEQETQIQQLKREKLSGSTNSDVNRLQSELEASRNSCEEQMCRELTKELESLQKQCYHKQMKLQTARQSRKMKSTTLLSRSEYNHQSYAASSVTDSTITESECTELDDDEWLEETGLLEDFESNEGGDIDLEWDFDEADLEQDFDSSPPNDIQMVESSDRSNTSSVHTVPQRKGHVPASNFKAANVVRVPSERAQTERAPSRPQLPTVLSFVTKKLSNNHPYSISSPSSDNIPRKRPGESIFKAPKLPNQISSNTKKSKKVRFHY